MENSNIAFAEKTKARTKLFAIRIIKLYQNLPKTEEAKIIGKQLLRSATSVGANYRAACRARSDNEYFAKISIVLEEADESLYWLELLEEAEIFAKPKLELLMQECLELVLVFAKVRKTLKNT